MRIHPNPEIHPETSFQSFHSKTKESAHFQAPCFTLQHVIENQADRIREKFGFGYIPSLPMISDASCLAHHEMLGSLLTLCLADVDLVSVPTKHLASLASHVTTCVHIINVSNCDMIDRLTVIHPTLFSTSRIELAKTVLFMIRFAHPIGWLRKIYNTKDTEMQFGHVNRGKWDDFIHVKIFHIHLAVFPGIRFKDSVVILIDCTNTFSFLVIHKSMIFR